MKAGWSGGACPKGRVTAQGPHMDTGARGGHKTCSHCANQLIGVEATEVPRHQRETEGHAIHETNLSKGYDKDVCFQR